MKQGSDVFLDSLEKEANRKFGLPHPAAGALATVGAGVDGGNNASSHAFKSNAVSGLHTFYYAWYGTPQVDGKVKFHPTSLCGIPPPRGRVVIENQRNLHACKN